MIKNLDVFSSNIFLIKVLLNKARKSIYSFIDFVLSIINLRIIFEKHLGLLNLIKAQIFYIFQLTDIIIIN